MSCRQELVALLPTTLLRKPLGCLFSQRVDATVCEVEPPEASRGRVHLRRSKAEEAPREESRRCSYV